MKYTNSFGPNWNRCTKSQTLQKCASSVALMCMKMNASFDTYSILDNSKYFSYEKCVIYCKIIKNPKIIIVIKEKK